MSKVDVIRIADDEVIFYGVSEEQADYMLHNFHDQIYIRPHMESDGDDIRQL